jgi:hypothetical protein
MGSTILFPKLKISFKESNLAFPRSLFIKDRNGLLKFIEKAVP